MIRAFTCFLGFSPLAAAKTAMLDEPVLGWRSKGDWAEAIVRNERSIAIDPETLLNAL
jgi:hypothetical protein